MYTAKLIKGKTYDVMDRVFKNGEDAISVDGDLYTYLEGNTHFSLTKEEQEDLGDKDEGAEVHTAASLKKLNADEQKAIITGLGGDLESVNNEEERIALILQLQEEQKAEKE